MESPRTSWTVASKFILVAADVRSSRAQERCESREVAVLGPSVPDKPYGFSRRKATVKQAVVAIIQQAKTP